MNIIDNNCDKNTDSAKQQKVLFDYNCKQLWPEEDVEEDNDYVPQLPEISDGSSNSAIEDMNDMSGAQIVQNISTESVKQSEDNNGLSDDRIVAPIKISKNKRKNSKNWSIVGQKGAKNKANNGIAGDICPNGSGPKKRGRKPKINGFTVTDRPVEHKPYKKVIYFYFYSESFINH